MDEWDEVSRAGSVDVHRRGGVVRLTLNRPERLNALDLTTSQALHDAAADLAEDDAVRCVLVTGAGRAFCAGADLGSHFGGEDARAAIERGMREFTNPTVVALRRMPKPVIAAVNGAAAGVGCALALACDLVVAAESAYFLLPFANLGLTVDGGLSLTLAARVGLGRAATMALLAERVPAAQASDWGLADQVVADPELASHTEQLAARLADGPTRSFAATKALLNSGAFGLLRQQLEDEATHQGGLVDTDDFRAAVAAFADRTRPTFTGH